MNRQNHSILTLPVAIILIIALLLTFLLTLPQKMENKRLSKQLDETQEKLQTQQEQLDAITRDIEALKRGDPKAIERVARDKFGYSRENEDIYNVDSTQTSQEQ